MDIAHIIGSIAPEDGGPPRVALQLAAAQARLGAGVRLITEQRPGLDRWWAQWRQRHPQMSAIELQPCPRPLTNGAGRRALAALRRSADVLHVHGLWDGFSWWSLSGAGGERALTVLAPHGMLSPWALNHHGLRKALALTLGWRRLVGSVDAMHAVSAGEREEIRALVPDSRVLLIPNGVAEEDLATAGLAAEPPPPGGPYVLYLARLHIMKGPDRLIEAFAHVLRDWPECGYRLVLAGPDFGMRASLEAHAARLGIADRVEFPGVVSGSEKRRWLGNATIVCQPSRYEASSLSLLEALAAGIPLVTTPEANFPEIEQAGAGVICPGEPEALARSLRRLLEDVSLRQPMGTKGTALIREHYTWQSIAAQSIDGYRMRLAERIGRGVAPPISA